jgi:hypothetical protein
MAGNISKSGRPWSGRLRSGSLSALAADNQLTRTSPGILAMTTTTGRLTPGPSIARAIAPQPLAAGGGRRANGEIASRDRAAPQWCPRQRPYLCAVSERRAALPGGGADGLGPVRSVRSERIWPRAVSGGPARAVPTRGVRQFVVQVPPVNAKRIARCWKYASRSATAPKRRPFCPIGLCY